MDKCKWFGHKWGRWEQIPPQRYGNLISPINEQKRRCDRCGKVDKTNV